MPLISHSLNLLRVTRRRTRGPFLPYLSTRVSLDTQQALPVRYSEMRPHDCGYGCAYPHRTSHIEYAEHVDGRWGTCRIALRESARRPNQFSVPYCGGDRAHIRASLPAPGIWLPNHGCGCKSHVRERVRRWSEGEEEGEEGGSRTAPHSAGRLSACGYITRR